MRAVTTLISLTEILLVIVVTALLLLLILRETIVYLVQKWGFIKNYCKKMITKKSSGAEFNTRWFIKK